MVFTSVLLVRMQGTSEAKRTEIGFTTSNARVDHLSADSFACAVSSSRVGDHDGFTTGSRHHIGGCRDDEI